MDAFFASAAEYFQGSGSGFVSVFCTVWRYLAPVLAVLLLWRCARPLLKFRREPETWAWLVMPDGNQLPLTHWENILGRAKGCDIVVDFPTVSRTHAVLTHYDDGSWSVTDIGSRGAVTLNGEPVQMAAVNYGDTISLGGVDMVLAPVTQSELEEQLASRTRPGPSVLPCADPVSADGLPAPDDAAALDGRGGRNGPNDRAELPRPAGSGLAAVCRAAHDAPQRLRGGNAGLFPQYARLCRHRL